MLKIIVPCSTTTESN